MGFLIREENWRIYRKISDIEDIQKSQIDNRLMKGEAMSKETVQFVEMIREASARLPRPPEEPPVPAVELKSGERWHFCWYCSAETPHIVRDRGVLDEVFTCQVCGTCQGYTVR